MKLASMTGFARQSGHAAPFRWTWEIKTVNSKGLDLRLRLPPGFDALDLPARAAVAKIVTRGACQVNLIVAREGFAGAPRINRELLSQVLSLVAALPRPEAVGPATLDGLLALRGVIEAPEEADDPEARAAVEAAMIRTVEEALDALKASRQNEGAQLTPVLDEFIARIEALVAQAEGEAAAQVEAIRDRFTRRISELAPDAPGLEDRIFLEAAALATKADVREELDRLTAHVASARQLVASAPAGRKLDFLMQEFMREANTLCSKSATTALTGIGLELKAVIEQLREQVQNVE